MVDFSTSPNKLLPVIGLTGGIGSGKSTAAGIFAALGIPVFNADERAKALYSESAKLRSWVVDSFGAECGEFEGDKLVGINRAALAEAVFGQPDRLQLLNQRIHPEVHKKFREWHRVQSQLSGAPYVMREAAILIESGSHTDCDAIVCVEAPVDVRATRAASRLGVEEAHIRERIAAQLTDEDRAQYATHRLFNDDADTLLSQVQNVHAAMMKRP